MKKAKVAILKTGPQTVLDDYVRLFELAGGPGALDKSRDHHPQGQHLLALPLALGQHHALAAGGDHPGPARSTASRDIACVQNKTEVTDAFKGEDLNNYKPIFRDHGIKVLFNFREEDMKWVTYKPKAKMLALDKIYGDELRIPDYFIGKNIVHLPTVKCHIYTTTTGAMKNAFGGLLNHKRHQTHTYIHETLVDLLAIQKEIHPGLFCLMDGTMAGNGPGPRVMKPEEKNVILASADQVAIDAVAAKLMGFDPMAINYIRLAHESGLGVGKPEEIEIVGDLDAARENWHFEVGF